MTHHFSRLGLYIVHVSVLLLCFGCQSTETGGRFRSPMWVEVALFPLDADAPLSHERLPQWGWNAGFGGEMYGPGIYSYFGCLVGPGSPVDFPEGLGWLVELDEWEVEPFFASAEGGIEGVQLGCYPDKVQWQDPRWQDIRWLRVLNGAIVRPPAQFRSLEFYEGEAFIDATPLGKAMAASPNLVSLHLTPRYTPDGEDRMDLPTGMDVTSLVLEWYELHDADSLAALVSWRKLTTLTLVGSGISAPAITALGQCPSLRTIRLIDCEMSEGTVAALAQVPGFEELVVSDFNLLEDFPSLAEELKSLPHLKRLAISGNGDGQPILDAVGTLTELKFLWLDNEFAHGDFSPLADLTDLQSFILESSGGNRVAEIVDALRSARDLEQLIISGWADEEEVVDDDLISLAETFPNLRDLRLARYIDMTDRGLAALCQLEHLEILGVESYHPVSPEALAGLEQLPNLRHLEIGQVDNAGAQQIGQLTQLESLTIAGELDDEGVVPLLAIQGLKYLDMDRTAITVEGVKQLASLRMLQMISALNLTPWYEIDEGISATFSSRMLFFDVGDSED